MAITALNSAATGLRALSTRIDVIANNLANAETTGYTRNGNFFQNRDGDIVLGMGDGYKLLPKINLPTDAREISINQEGVIDYIRPGQNTRTIAGKLKISNFSNPQGLKLMGGSIYVQTEASGPSVDSKPGENGSGTILQGFLEGSSVDPVKELVTLIKTQRSFELNSQSIQTADQALQTIGNLRRF